MRIIAQYHFLILLFTFTLQAMESNILPSFIDEDAKIRNSLPLPSISCEGIILDEQFKKFLHEEFKRKILEFDNDTSIHHSHGAYFAGNFSVLIEEYPELVNVEIKNGWTVLHYAAKFGSLKFCKRLIELKVDIDKVDYSGKTAGDIAGNHLHNSVQSLLYQYEKVKKKPSKINYFNFTK